jgi:hypothetical protein
MSWLRLGQRDFKGLAGGAAALARSSRYHRFWWRDMFLLFMLPGR